jgi:LmbE family N-acetylglucosaminyl deacetylase
MQTILGVWAHPDDEAYLSAGLMAAARAAGDHVVVVTATRGELGGNPDMRAGEMAAALAALDVGAHHWLDFRDGACAEVPLAIGAAAVRRVIDAVRPDLVVTFGPDGLTGHPDHRAVSAWTTAAWAAGSRPGRLWYATMTPGFYEQWGKLVDALGAFMTEERPSTPPSEVALTVRCSGPYAARKSAALRAHASQTDSLRAIVGDDVFDRMWATEWFVDAGAPSVRALSA